MLQNEMREAQHKTFLQFRLCVCAPNHSHVRGGGAESTRSESTGCVSSNGTLEESAIVFAAGESGMNCTIFGQSHTRRIRTVSWGWHGG